MERLKELAGLCKAGISIDIDEHKNCLQTMEEYISTLRMCGVIEPEGEDDEITLSQIIYRDTIVEIHAYRDTPVGAFVVRHYDIDEAIDLAIKYCKEG